MRKKIEEIIRVNQAGEDGAIRIYNGQLAALKDGGSKCKIKQMHDQELEHLEYFNAQIIKMRVRPTALSPIWKVGAYVLGYVSGKLGAKAAMACTAAVEEVIERHYQEQIDYLEVQEGGSILELKKAIQKFQLDEIQHKEIGSTNSDDRLYYDVLKSFVRGLTKFAIGMSKKF